MSPSEQAQLEAQLQRLQLHYIREHCQALAAKAAAQQLPHLDYLAQLIEGEAAMRESRSIQRRIRNARFPAQTRHYRREGPRGRRQLNGKRSRFFEITMAPEKEDGAC